MTIMGPHDLDHAVSDAVRALRGVAHLDWSAPAGGLEWSCHDTAVHLAGDLTGFAAQLAGRVTESWLPLRVTAAPDTSPSGVVDLVEASGRLLVAAVHTAGPDVRAWHPAGSAGPDGFAAMGAAETLLHCHDILGGLGATHWRGSERTAALVLERLFPHAPLSTTGDPWDSLLAATGRVDLPDLAPQENWRWYNDPIRGVGVILCEIGPAAAADLHAGGTGGFAWTEDGPAEGTRIGAGMVGLADEVGEYRPGWGPYAIVRARDHRAIGGIGFHGAPDPDGQAEIGYDLVASARRQGHATEALRALAGWAFAQPGLTGLHARVDEDNVASQAVVRRAGFQESGTDDGVVRYRLSPL
ncbi:MULTISPECIES: GNAT family N-acetyltransferase [unclassified Streptomyces]|uniref:GNAT family N-acetyltransferase n=1 Tax=unclassified Streptomyces TaxID=2593676 RepID=UPI002271460F|nr:MULTISPECIES: GNAT family N-acetyltransferase [unclassified Streptomyces]MCY0921439.1 GNAT family N-acetyltransferase [Streptomyces sp. H27-G5]MCY0960872.1 GNAT family N-acetyltransferase [Streptomyces sp. H27-H5]